MFAVEKENIQIINKLLKYGAEIDAQDHRGNTPLMMACKKRKIDVVRRLLEAGANPNIKNYHLSSALIKAVLSGSVEIVDMPIKKGADSFVRDEEGRNLAEIAIQKKDNKIFYIVEPLVMHDTIVQHNDKDIIKMLELELNIKLKF